MIREVTNMNKHELYHNHNYVYLLTSNIINRCGDSLDTILFTWLVYLLTNSAGWSATIFGINQATSVIIQPFIGPLVENMNKKKVLVLSDIARVLLVLYILYVYTQNMLSPLILVFMTISISLIEAFHMPAGVAVIQHVLPNEHYDKGVSVNVSCTKIAVLVGTGLSGIVISSFGIGISLAIDALIFLISALLIVKIEFSVQEEKKTNRIIGREYLISLRDGFSYVFDHKKLLKLCFLCILINSAVVPFDALLAPIAREMFSGDAKIVSLLSVSVTIGTILGSLTFAKMKEEKKNNTLVTFCGIVLGVYYVFIAFVSKYIANSITQKLLLLIGSIIIGAALGLMITYVQVKFVKEVTKEYIGRVSAIRFSLTYACAPVVSFVISIIYKVTVVDTSSLFVGFGIVIIILFLLANKITFSPLKKGDKSY